MRRGRRSLTLAVLMAVGAAALPAAAQATLSAYGEPTYTKGTSNSFWYLHQSQGSAELYCWKYKVNYGAEQAVQNYPYCDSYNSTAGVAIKRTLGGTSGNTYSYYAERYVDLGGWTFYPCATTSCYLATTLDTSKPTATAYVDGTSQYTRNPVLAVHIDYNDSISPPWFGPSNTASNFDALARGSAPTSLSYDPGCSHPNSYQNRINSFDCTYDLTSQPDGQWFYCVRAADAAVPDNAASSNQFIATSDQANLSDPACGNVILDRGAPSVTPSASATDVQVGQLVNFSASATDALSGVSGSYQWVFGDNTPNGSGANTAHTYTQPGTFQVLAKTTDGAGNAGQAPLTITVHPAPISTGPGSGSGSGSGAGGTLTPSTITPTTVSQQAGGGGTQSRTIAGLKLIAPKKFKAGKRTLVLAATAATGGKLKVSFLKRAKIVSQAAASLPSAGTYAVKLKVPKKLKKGTYSIQVAFTPNGAPSATIRTLKIRVVVAKRRRSHGKAIAPGVHGGVPTAPAYQPGRATP